jgi:hypothetical protein
LHSHLGEYNNIFLTGRFLRYFFLIQAESGVIYLLGYLAIGSDLAVIAIPRSVDSFQYFNNEEMKEISSGNGGIGVVSTLGNLYMFGYDNAGQLGLGSDAILLGYISIPQQMNASYFNNETVQNVYCTLEDLCLVTSGILRSK